ncbi:DUF6207 family protein [Streptomyces mirabilis]
MHISHNCSLRKLTRSGESGTTQNLAAAARVQKDVEPIREAHVAEPGLLVIDVAGAYDTTVFAFQDAVAQLWPPA